MSTAQGDQPLSDSVVNVQDRHPKVVDLPRPVATGFQTFLDTLHCETSATVYIYARRRHDQDLITSFKIRGGLSMRFSFVSAKVIMPYSIHHLNYPNSNRIFLAISAFVINEWASQKNGRT
jgi:hypothetical protein